MFRSIAICGIAFLTVGALSLGLSAETGAETNDDKPNDSKIWSGIFTAAQVERGKADYEKSCSNCHVSDLSGSVRAPALHGSNFMQQWQNGSVGVLFEKLRDSMPANYPESVPDETKINILAFLLQQNGFPAGAQELKINEKELADIQIEQKGNQTAPNFALVRVVGCLTQGQGKGWAVSKSTEPVVTKAEKPTAASLKSAADAPLGSQSFDLISAAAFKPESHNGQRVEVRGLLYRAGNRNLLNLTSLESAGPRCE